MDSSSLTRQLPLGSANDLFRLLRCFSPLKNVSQAAGSAYECSKETTFYFSALLLLSGYLLPLLTVGTLKRAARKEEDSRPELPWEERAMLSRCC